MSLVVMVVAVVVVAVVVVAVVVIVCGRHGLRPSLSNPIISTTASPVLSVPAWCNGFINVVNTRPGYYLDGWLSADR